MTDPVIYSLVAIVLVVLLFLALREVICWYWKINSALAELRAIHLTQRELLTATRAVNDRLLEGMNTAVQVVPVTTTSIRREDER